MGTPRAHDLTGTRFGRLVAVAIVRSQRLSDRKLLVHWYCECACGATAIVRAGNLTSGWAKSCGCLQREVASAAGLDLTGQPFGRWLVLHRVNRVSRPGRRAWLCRCDCGTETIQTSQALVDGYSTSCGCYHRECVRRPKSHGHQVSGKRSREYQSWTNAKSRCFNPALPSYPMYGGRGITMCPEWRDSFETFLQGMGSRPAGTSLDRIDNDGHYEPGNCRWAARAVQQNNQRANRRLTFRGETRTVAEWARVLGIPANRIRGRLFDGWSDEAALSTH